MAFKRAGMHWLEKVIDEQSLNGRPRQA